MKIGVISDTHGDVQSLKQVIAAAGEVDHWLHAGDHCKDGYLLGELTNLPVTVIAGNCDRTLSARPDEYVDIAGKTIWVTHGHRHNVKYGVQELVWWGKQYGADIVVFGHTHIPYNAWHEGLLLFNPGSPRLPRGGSFPSCGIIHILEDGIIEANIIKL